MEIKAPIFVTEEDKLYNPIFKIVYNRLRNLNKKLQ